MGKKKLGTMLVSVGLIGAMVAGGSLAYLTDRDSEVNVFTVGDVRIELNEKFEQGAKLVPGKTIEKETIIKNIGSNDAYVWMELAVPSALDVAGNASDNVIHWNVPGAFWDDYRTVQKYIDSAIEKGYLPSGSGAVAAEYTWNVDDEVDMVQKTGPDGKTYNVYTLLYNSAIKPGGSTNIGLNQVYMDAHIDIDTNGDWFHVENGVIKDLDWNTKDDGEPRIYVSAYAVQAEGFENVLEARAAYASQWGDKGTEWADANIINAAPESGAVRPAGYNPLTSATPNTVSGITVFDNSDDTTNLRALYTGDGGKVAGNLTVTDCYLDGTYAMNVIGNDTGVLTVSDTDLRGWVSYAGFTSATFTNCTFAENTNPEIHNTVRPYSNVTFVNCAFDGTAFRLNEMPVGATAIFKNCTMDGVLIESADRLNVPEGSKDCVVINNN